MLDRLLFCGGALGHNHFHNVLSVHTQTSQAPRTMSVRIDITEMESVGGTSGFGSDHNMRISVM